VQALEHERDAQGTSLRALESRVADAESAQAGLAERLDASQRGHDIVVVTRQATPELPRADGWSDVALYRFPFWDVLHDGRPSAVLALQGEVDRLYRDLKPDVVHLSGFGPSALFVLQAQQTSQAPLLVTLHSSNTLSAYFAELEDRLNRGERPAPPRTNT